MAKDSHVLTAASHELGVADLILSYLEPPEAQAVGITAGLEAYAAKPLGVDIAEHYTRLGHLTSLKSIVGTVISLEDANRLMYDAARGGHEAIVRQCHEEWGASADQAMAMAAYFGHEGIVRLCHEWGAITDGWAMAAAASGGHKDLVQLCHDDWGVTDPANINWAMRSAAIYGHENIVLLCLKWGATNFDDAITRASIRGHEAIVRLCREWKDRIQHMT